MVAQVLDKLLGVCCGDNSPLGGKMPWNKNNKDEDHDVAVKPTKQNAKPSNVKPSPMQKANKNGKFTDKDMKYETIVWKSLPLSARKAAQDLGYDQTKWDSSEHLPIEHKHWRDLDEKELKAVKTLGWEEEAWERQYEHHKWADLPDLQKKAAVAAGLTEDTWEHHWPANLEKHWDDLAEEDKNAMAVFGWCKSAWD